MPYSVVQFFLYVEQVLKKIERQNDRDRHTEKEKRNRQTERERETEKNER